MNTYKILDKPRGLQIPRVIRRNLTRDEVIDFFRVNQGLYNNAVIDVGNLIMRHDSFVMSAEAEQ